MKTDLLELAAKVEAAEGPDRELDRSIFAFKNPHLTHLKGTARFYDQSKVGKLVAEKYITAGVYTTPLYTASVDEALSLVPDGWFARLFCEGPQVIIVRAFSGSWKEVARSSLCTTPALAITAACLRAIAAEGV